MHKRSICLAAALAIAAMPATASAAVTPSVDGTTATLTGDDAGDTVVLSVVSGDLAFAVGSSAPTTDWGGQTVPANETIDVVVGLGGGDDSFTATTDLVKTLTVDGGAANDLLFGTNKPDTLTGGDGDDRVVGNRGGDAMKGGAGNDTLVWNNGDGSDVMDGEAGNDGVEVNGAPTAGDTFTIQPNAGRVKFDRTNLGLFTLDIGTTERLNVNGLAGDDMMTGAAGLAPLILLLLDGGPGKDTLTGGDGPDLLQGGEDADALAGAGADDRVIGNRGNDTMAGGDGDDTLVWNNGDNNDKADGDAGYDFMEINGAPAAGDAFTVKPENGRARFDRTNLVPFFVDISAEVLDLNTLGGDDALTVADGSPIIVDADGGSGNDTLTAAGANDSLNGGSGNDTLTGGGGIDALDGSEGDDTVNARDGATDLVRCAGGTDKGVADREDVHDGCETWDVPAAPPAPPAPPAAKAPVLSIASIKQSKRKISIAVSCADAACKGQLRLITAKALKLGRLRTVLQLGTLDYDLAAGQSRTLTIKLPARFQGLIPKKKKVAVRAIAHTTGGATATRSGSVKR